MHQLHKHCFIALYFIVVIATSCTVSIGCSMNFISSAKSSLFFVNAYKQYAPTFIHCRSTCINSRLLLAAASSSSSSSPDIKDTSSGLKQSTSCTDYTKSSLKLLSSFYQQNISYTNQKSKLQPLSAFSSKKNDNYPILPLSTIQKYIGKNRQVAKHPFTWKELQRIMIELNDPSLLSRSMQIQSNYIWYREKMRDEWVDFNDCIVYSKFGDVDDDDQEEDTCTRTLFTKMQCAYTNKYKIQPSLQQTKEQNITIQRLLPNDFPYFVESNIEHWCLWKLNGSVSDDDIQCAIDELKIYALLEEQEEEEKKQWYRKKKQNKGEEGQNVEDSMYYISCENDNDNDAYTYIGKVIDTIAWINPKHLQSIPDIDHAHILCLREKKNAR